MAERVDSNSRGALVKPRSAYTCAAGRWFCATRDSIMRLPTFLRPFELPSLAVLGVMLVFPAGAQTASESQSPSTGTPGAETQSHSTDAPTSSNPATPKPTSIPAPMTTESVPHAESTPGTKETGSSILITIDKANQRMTVSIDGAQQYEW